MPDDLSIAVGERDFRGTATKFRKQFSIQDNCFPEEALRDCVQDTTPRTNEKVRRHRPADLRVIASRSLAEQHLLIAIP